MVNSVTGTTMFDWWSLQMDVISGVDHWRLDPVGPLLMDGMQQHSGTDVVLQVSWDNANFVRMN